MSSRQRLSRYEFLSLFCQAAGVLSLICIVWQTKLLRDQTKSLSAQTKFVAEQTKSLSVQTQFVGEQTKLAAQQIEANTEQARGANMAAIDALFVENAAFYSYFYEGMPINRDHVDYPKILTVAMAMTNYLESSLSEYDNPTLLSWKRYIDDQFALSPILCEYLDARRAWFQPKLVSIMEKNRDLLNDPSERKRLLPESLLTRRAEFSRPSPKEKTPPVSPKIDASH